MNDDLTVLLIQSINLNPNLDAALKLDLIKKTMSDCQEKRIGKIIVDAIEKVDKANKLINIPIKRGRGRPRKTENQERMLKISRDADIADGRRNHE